METNIKVIYFHGYKSSPNSDKVKDLRTRYESVFAPNIPLDYLKAFAYLSPFINDVVHLDDRPTVLVGTSLGGYWANEMKTLFNLPAVLVNPCCYPRLVLKDPEFKKMFCYKPISHVEARSPTVVLLAKDDDVLDYKIAKSVFEKVAQIVEFETGGHRFNDVNTISRYINEVANLDFLSNDNI